ncbi:MAG: flagellar hook-basal body complex protein FliE [Candidatus Poribacteria bacterium]|nr:flagellar hook-basal body complex protein FliE [Candidatus Poribacteria bacterium]
MTINGISIASRIAASQLQPAPSRDGRTSQSGGSFKEVLNESLQKVNTLQKEADKAIEDLVVGDQTDIAQTMVAVQKASLSFQLMTQVRNHLVQAYEEVMRMQV